MKIKRFISGILAATMAATSLTGALTITASAATEDEYFTYSYNPYVFTPGEYVAELKTGADFSKLNNGELALPDTFDDGTNGVANVSIGSMSASNDTIKSIKTKSSIGSMYRRAFRYLNALEKVEYTTTGTLTLKERTFEDCSSTLKDVFIYASSVEFDTSSTASCAFMTFIDSADAKIHVASEDVKQQIINGTADGSAPVTADKIEVMETSLPTPVVTLTCEDIDFGTEGGFKPSATVKVNDSPVEDAKVTIKMFWDADCVREYTGSGGYTSSNIAVGTYYFRASVEGTDTYMGAMSAILEVHVREVVVDKTKLNEAIEAADSFKKSAIEEDYDAAAWRAVFGLSDALHNAKIVADQASNLTQAMVDAATTTLNEALEKLKNSPVDATAEWAELEGLIKDAELLDESEFTEDSYAKLKSAVDSAKALSKDTATKTQIQKAISALKTAKEGLEVDQVVIPAGDPFAYVRYNYTATPFYKGTTDESMVGATRIRLTFDCAEDTSFNKYFTTNYSVDVGGIKSDSEVRGVGEENLGEKGCSAVLNLTSPIESGKSYSIIGYTYGYSNAKDYIFAITKIEFLDDTGHILKTITDATVAKEQLDAAIAKAEAVDATAYTAESYAELTKAIDAAKALKDDATATEITAAKDAIEAAIKALKPIEITVLGAIEGTIKTPGADAEVAVTVATADGQAVAEATAASGEYSISDLEDGDYVITFAADGFVARSYAVTVAGGNVSLEAEIHLYGDVNGDGKITTADAGIANAHARQVAILEGYDFDVAEVTGDGKVTTADFGAINAQAQGIK